MGTHSSILTWKIPWSEEYGGLKSLGLQESDMTEQLTHTHTSKVDQTCQLDILNVQPHFVMILGSSSPKKVPLTFCLCFTKEGH